MLLLIFLSDVLLGALTAVTIQLITDNKITPNKLAAAACILLNAAVPLLMQLPSEKLPFIVRLLILVICTLGKFIFFSLLFRKIKADILYICLISIITSQIYSTLLEWVFQSGDFQRIAAYLLESLILGLLILYLKRNNNNTVLKENLKVIPKRLYAEIAILLYAVCLFIWSAVNSHEALTRYLMIPALGGFVFVIVAVMQTSISKVHEQQISDILSDQIDSQVEYYNKINMIYDEFRSFRHDLNNHLLCLRSLMSAGENEKALEYMDSIENMSSVRKKQYNTGNIIIDALLDDKKERAVSSGIDLKFNGYIPTNGIGNTDICIIVANAIDNAIEACQKGDKDAKKEIVINSDFRQGYFFFNISNPIFENVRYSKNRIITSKKDQNNHGYGISNIMKTVKKYDGQADISTDDHEFKLDISLRLKPDNAG
ncbi:MAG: GHKL domain-containing protein [Ruminococcus sp.]|nr:GHKL domain-containing protein [Ruminococcus sp.]